jgi:hypothetical protein
LRAKRWPTAGLEPVKVCPPRKSAAASSGYDQRLDEIMLVCYDILNT